MPIQKITKEEILKIAADVFRAKGYHNTSMQDLAAACGLLKGSFYHYFASKEALMQALLAATNDYLDKRAFCIAFDEQLTPEQRLDQLLRNMGKIAFEREGGCLVGNTTLETTGLVPQFEPLLKAFFDNWIAALQHIFAQKKPADVAKRLAQQTVVEMEGAVMLANLYKDRQFLKDAFVRAMTRLA